MLSADSIEMTKMQAKLTVWLRKVLHFSALTQGSVTQYV